MILGFGAKNAWSFKDWMDIDLTLSEGVPKDVSMNFPASTAVCINGANASGKTNIFKVLNFIKQFALDTPDSSSQISPFFDSTDSSSFYLSLRTDKFYYRYEFEINQTIIIEEKLFRKKISKDSRETLAFHRQRNSIIRNTISRKPKSDDLNTGTSVISIMKNKGIKETEDLYACLSEVEFNTPDLNIKNILMDEQKLSYIATKLKRFDTGICDLKIDEHDSMSLKCLHERENQAPYAMNYESESDGTKKLITILLLGIEAITDGSTLLLDDMTDKIHPDIISRLLDMFIIQKNNPKGAQIIFTSMNSKTMDILGKYRSFIVEKTKGESICYRIDEIKSTNIRNDRPISVLYDKKLIGGIPIIDEA